MSNITPQTIAAFAVSVSDRLSVFDSRSRMRFTSAREQRAYHA